MTAPGDGAVAPLPVFFRTTYLAAATGISAGYVVATLVAPPSFILLPIGLLILLLLPGYALGALLFGPRPRLPWPALFPIVVGMSVAFNIAFGLLRLELRLGLQAAALGAASLGLSVIALVVYSVRTPASSPHPYLAYLRQELALPSFSPWQRRAAYGLLGGIVVVLVVLLYLSTVHPNESPTLALGVYGPDGTAGSLPRSGFTNQAIAVSVSIANNATTQEILLVVASWSGPLEPTSFTQVPWVPPLALGNGTASSEGLNLTPAESTSTNVSFEFTRAGSYTVAIELAEASGSPLRVVTFAVSVQ